MTGLTQNEHGHTEGLRVVLVPDLCEVFNQERSEGSPPPVNGGNLLKSGGLLNLTLDLAALSLPGVSWRRGPHSEGPDHRLLAHSVSHAQVQHPALATPRLRGLQKVRHTSPSYTPFLPLVQVC